MQHDIQTYPLIIIERILWYFYMYPTREGLSIYFNVLPGMYEIITLLIQPSEEKVTNLNQTKSMNTKFIKSAWYLGTTAICGLNIIIFLIFAYVIHDSVHTT